MTLEEKWEILRQKLEDNWTGLLPSHVERIAKQSFYIGAEAGIDTIPIPEDKDFHDVQSEIDKFKKENQF
jgi:hypothetical protein